MQEFFFHLPHWNVRGVRLGFRRDDGLKSFKKIICHSTVVLKLINNSSSLNKDNHKREEDCFNRYPNTSKSVEKN